MPTGSKAECFTLVEEMPKSLCYFLYWQYYTYDNMNLTDLHWCDYYVC